MKRRCRKTIQYRKKSGASRLSSRDAALRRLLPGQSKWNRSYRDTPHIITVPLNALRTFTSLHRPKTRRCPVWEKRSKLGLDPKFPTAQMKLGGLNSAVRFSVSTGALIRVMPNFPLKAFRPRCSLSAARGKFTAETILAAILALAPGWLVSASLSADPVFGGTDLSQLSLEDLGNVRITTVSRKPESLSGAAAAIHVVSQEDIRRTGATSLADALRMVPGLNVARANSRQWAVTSRGFNGTFANKLLVLMDGRSIYTPLFSGVLWEEADTVLEDVDQIEVVRGPGATMWGANAVNGVINIVTKSAKLTQGILISGGGGTEEKGFATLRYGGQFSTNGYYRVYGKYSNRDDFPLESGGSAHDSWWMSQEGFRLDWQATPENWVTMQGDYYYGELGGSINQKSLEPFGVIATPFRSKVEGANVLSRWTHKFSDESDLIVQTYYDRTDRGFGVGEEQRDTLDIDAQHRFPVGDRQEIVWGSGYRYSVDEITESPDFMAIDPTEELHLVSAFAQDEIEIVPDRVRVRFGVKAEHNGFTGFEFQPSGRISWTPNERQTVWASISRAVRTPSRIERGFSFFVQPPATLPPLPLPTVIPGSGNPDFDSEKVTAFEAGYRVKPSQRISIDFSSFYNKYDRLWTAVNNPIELHLEPVPHLLIPTTIGNDIFGETFGIEISETWRPIDSWRLTASYTLLKMHLHTRGPLRSITEDSEGVNPQQQIFFSSDVDLGKRVEWGVGVRYVDSTPGQKIDDYWELNSRISWKPTEKCELSLIGRHLLDPRHREFAPLVLSVNNVEIERAVYLKLTVRL